LRTTDPEKMQQVLYSLLEITRYLGIILQSFIPDVARTMLDQLGIPNKQRQFAHLTKEFALKP